VLASVLAQFGSLTRAGLLCERCVEDDARKAMLGCGVPPRSGEAEFLPANVEEEAARVGAAPNADIATRLYPLANLGHISDIIGGWWECCPRYYAEMGDRSAQAVARLAMKAAESIRRKMPLHPCWSSASGRGERLLRIAIDAYRWARHDEEERVAADSKRKREQNKPKTTGRSFR